jgi:hypothetical protein
MKLQAAYLAALAPELAGFYFNAVELIGRAGATPPALAAKVESQAQLLLARRPETINLVMLAEARAIQAGLPQPFARPSSPAEFHAWAKQTSEFVESVARKDVREHAAFLLGYVVGDLLLSLGLRAVVRDLLSVAPDNAFLNAQHAALRASEQKATANLELAATNPGLPEATRAKVTEMLPVIKTLDQMADPQMVLNHLDPQRKALETTLAG